MQNKGVHQVAYLLVVIGALNWGLVGLLDLNLVEMIFGSYAGVAQIVYIAIGVAALVDVAMHMSYCKYCSGKK